MILIDDNDDRFYIDKSTLPNAGWGLFAKKVIKKGDWVEVLGVMVKSGSVTDLYCTAYAKRYKFAGSKPDTKIVPMGYAGIINHTDDPSLLNVNLTKIPGLKKRSEHSSEIVYHAIRDIQPNEELLGNYGEQIGRELEEITKNME